MSLHAFYFLGTRSVPRFILYNSREFTVFSLRLIAECLVRLAELLDDSKPSLFSQEIETAAQPGQSLEISEKSTHADFVPSPPTPEEPWSDPMEPSCALLDYPADPQLRARYDSVSSESSQESGVGDLELPVDPATGLEIYSLEEVGEHCCTWDAWMVVYDKVYDVTEYLNKHPGGEDVMLEYIGYDATIAFRGVGHSKAAFRGLSKYCIGILPTDQRLNYEF